MPIEAHIPQCQHIKMDGVRCGSPAMRGAPKCYYHIKPPKIDNLRIGDVRDPRERIRAISEVCNALLAHKIDPKRASALLYAMQVAQHD